MTVQPHLTRHFEPWRHPGRAPSNVLVMFAGTGAEMLEIDKLSKDEITITGVELNGLVVELGRNARALKRHRVAKFLDLERINLV